MRHLSHNLYTLGFFLIIILLKTSKNVRINLLNEASYYGRSELVCTHDQSRGVGQAMQSDFLLFQNS